MVHALPSSQVPVFAVCVQPPAASQPSSVHGFLSSQGRAPPPMQEPPLQWSPVVHTDPSLHGAWLAMCRHAVTALQLSSVQALPSEQFIATPLAHCELAHASPTVHALPSLQGTLLATWTQPPGVAQPSSVHALPSLQFRLVAPTQAELLQTSVAVQMLPSLQGAVLATFLQPVPAAQLSSVHTLPSSQLLAGPPTHTLAAHASPAVHGSPSSHAVVLARCWQPTPPEHSSVVQMLPSSQLRTTVPAQSLSLQTSVEVHEFPSSHATVLAAWMQPAAALQLSLVQTLPSLQSSAGPPTQTLAEQASDVVHALPSLHTLAFATKMQPTPSRQLSLVQTLPSVHLGGGPPTQTKATHLSFVVQTSPSSHGAVFCVWLQPETGSQASSVHASLSLHDIAVPPWHLPLEHFSLLTHIELLLHGTPSEAFLHSDVQQSPLLVLPSSHCSKPLTQPSPQVLRPPMMAALMSMRP